MVRLDMKNGLAADLHTWYWEAADKLYQTTSLPKYYKQIAEVNDVKDIKGGYWKGTSAIGASVFEDRGVYEARYEDKPQEGFTVYATIKAKGLKIKVPYEHQRDWHRSTDFLQDYVKKNWPKAYEETLEVIIADFLSKAGYASGDDIYNNDSADLNLTTYTSPKLQYDAAPVINRSASTRTAKSTSTFHNGLATGATVDYSLAKQLWNLLTATNAYKENGQPFDNSQDVVVVTTRGLGLDWDMALNSVLNPDNANNGKNPMKGKVKDIYEHPNLSAACVSAAASFMLRRSNFLKVWFSTGPRTKFWTVDDPEAYWAGGDIDYAITMPNFRTGVGNNLPTA